MSGNIQCAADLYLPTNTRERLPCVVMGHGFTGTKDLGLPVFAREFAANGFAALVFDYRHFGKSEGEPRQIIDVNKQRQDFQAAVECARNIDRIDPERIILWGSSLAAGHVLAVSARDPRIAATIAMVPFIDAKKGKGSEKTPAGTMFKLMNAAMYDFIRGLFNLRPVYVPAVGKPGDYAVMTEPGALEITEELMREGSTWRNEFAPRVAFAMPTYIEGTIEKLKSPLLFCIAEHDVQASKEFASDLARKATLGEVHTYPAGHFGLYVGEMRDRTISDQITFLRKYVK